ARVAPRRPHGSLLRPLSEVPSRCVRSGASVAPPRSTAMLRDEGPLRASLLGRIRNSGKRQAVAPAAGRPVFLPGIATLQRGHALAHADDVRRDKFLARAAPRRARGSLASPARRGALAFNCARVPAGFPLRAN